MQCVVILRNELHHYFFIFQAVAATKLTISEQRQKCLTYPMHTENIFCGSSKYAQIAQHLYLI